MTEVVLTDPKRRGTLEYNNELIIFTSQVIEDQSIISYDDFNLYVDGVLTEKDIAQHLFNRKI